MLRSMSQVEDAPPHDSNAHAYSVSELAFALKRTLEESYGFVRLRGEVSKVTRHSNGHIYLDLKDENASIAGVVWRGAVKNLKAQPEQGLEVVVTGKITTFPPRSSYQLIIETMELAGIGALLAQLERLKAKLQAEGLFDVARKRPLPSMPMTIGVVTSPTGAVIRDILHRIRDRWPAHVLVWPVVVQGPDAAAQVSAAIAGFNALAPDGPVPRPDVLIVARGGGSIEDLHPFNDEALVRAAAASVIPLISAVGHETDTTLIDFASSRRAPTPTAAAEFATPILADLKGAVLDMERRMARCTAQGLETRRSRLAAAARGLPRPTEILALATQRFDLAAGRLSAALGRNTAAHDRDFARVAGRLSPALLQRPRQARVDRLKELGLRLTAAAERRVKAADDRLQRLDHVRRSLDPKRPLALGFAMVTAADGSLIRSATGVKAGDPVQIRFGDDSVAGARIEGGARPQKAKSPATPPSAAQGDLF
jgi:exodeoxyribonuclease VII large subunit